jgi:hypothetical protein
MAAKRSAALLCLLICIFGMLTIIMKQYALVWWIGCIVAAFVGSVIVATNLQVQEAAPRMWLRASVFIVPAAALVLGLLIGYVTSR